MKHERIAQPGVEVPPLVINGVVQKMDPNPEVVVIEVFGGVAEATQVPEGVIVQIIDHDNEG